MAGFKYVALVLALLALQVCFSDRRFDEESSKIKDRDTTNNSKHISPGNSKAENAEAVVPPGFGASYRFDCSTEMAIYSPHRRGYPDPGGPVKNLDAVLKRWKPLKRDVSGFGAQLIFEGVDSFRILLKTENLDETLKLWLIEEKNDVVFGPYMRNEQPFWSPTIEGNRVVLFIDAKRIPKLPVTVERVACF